MWCLNDAADGDRFCAEHRAALDRVAIAIGTLKPPKFEGTDAELTAALVAHVVEAGEPVKREELARSFGFGKASAAFARAVRAAVEAGDLALDNAGKRPALTLPKLATVTTSRVVVAPEDAIARVTAVVGEHGPMTAYEAAERLEIPPSTATRWARMAVEAGSLHRAGGKLTTEAPADIVEVLRTRGPLSRADLAAAVGVSTSTLGIRLRELRSSGVLAPGAGHDAVRLAA